MKWQTIETAPRDGTRVLLLVEHGEFPVVGYGEKCLAGTVWRAEDEHFGISCCTDYCGGGVTTAFEFNPTHWMPLPEPPDA